MAGRGQKARDVTQFATAGRSDFVVSRCFFPISGIYEYRGQAGQGAQCLTTACSGRRSLATCFLSIAAAPLMPGLRRHQITLAAAMAVAAWFERGA
jgi:hypothetical protein